MGFFKSITKVFKQAIPAVATGGLSLLAPKSVQQTLGAVLAPTSFGDLRTSFQIAAPAVATVASGGAPMAFNFGNFLGGASKVLAQNTNPYLSGLGQMTSAFAPAYTPPSYGAPTTQPQAQAYPVAAQLPVARQPSLTRDIFNIGAKVLQKIGLGVPANAGQFSNVLKRSMSALSAIARRSPTGTILTVLGSLGLSAMEAAQLATWYQQKKRRRRMNPANHRALKRSIRRIHSFHKLCSSADILKSRGHRRSGSSCGTCKKKSCRGC